MVSEIMLEGERVICSSPNLHDINPAVPPARRRAIIKSIRLTSSSFTTNSICRRARWRVNTGGGNAGHNGLKSLTEHLGNDYRRVRIGIGHPGDKELVHNYVLSDFAKAEIPWVEALCNAIAAHAGLLAKGEDANISMRDLSEHGNRRVWQSRAELG